MSNLSPDPHSLDALRHEAKRLQRAYDQNVLWARERLAQYPPRKSREQLVRADFLHVIAQQNGFASWPQLKLAAQTQGLDRATALQRLKIALARGNVQLAQALLTRWPDLADGLFGLQCALYQRDAVAQALAADPGLATRQAGPRSPIVHLAFSKWIHLHPELHDDMMGIAALLLAHGADVNDSTTVSPDNPHRLSALYGALGHANNMPLAQWLLDQIPTMGKRSITRLNWAIWTGSRCCWRQERARRAPMRCCARWISTITQRCSC
jgi:hypothetical protein